MPYKDVYDEITTFEWPIAGAVFAIVVLLLAFAIVRYRAGARSEASQQTEHPKVEAAYAVVLLLLAVAIVTYTSQLGRRDGAAAATTPQVKLAVTGYQWCWRFHYLGTPVQVSADCQDGHYPTVVLPANEPIAVDVGSDDVIHSFWVPEFRYKMDAFPHHTNTFEMTIPRTGEWLGHCAEFCGLEHSTMLFHVKAVTAAQFRSWLQSRQAAATTAGAAG